MSKIGGSPIANRGAQKKMIFIIGENSLAKQLKWLIEKEDVKFFFDAESALSSKLEPNRILLDVDFLIKKEVNVLSAFKDLRKKFPKAEIILFTAYEKERILDGILQEVNAKLVHKGGDPEILIKTLLSE